MAAEPVQRPASRPERSGASRLKRIQEQLQTQRPVILDGATGTELIDSVGARPEADEQLWGVAAVLDAPESVQAVHRAYVEAGCDVLSTNTWGLPSAVRRGPSRAWDPSRPVHWMDVARRGVRLARAAAAEAGRPDDVAVALSLNGDLVGEGCAETLRLLTRAMDDDPPDLVLLETLSIVGPDTYEAVEGLLSTGLPVWLSFRRCRHGVCGVYGEHPGGPEGDAFGRVVRRFEELGVGATLINCIPPDHVAGMLSWLRDFTDMPLGAYPNLGYLSAAGWRHHHDVAAEDYAEMALGWRAEGAQIIGGCCGVGPDHIAAVQAKLAGTLPGTERPDALSEDRAGDQTGPAAEFTAWKDRRGRKAYPIDFPEIVVEPGVAPLDATSLLAWRYLEREDVGRDGRCLDVGCGSGILSVQLARNRASHVHAIDRDPKAVQNTLANAFRCGVSDRVTAAAIDLFPWVPKERYDIIVACLDQMPVDPAEQAVSHRPVDFWGRSLLDHLIGLLPEALETDGVAYVLQLSVIGERETSRRLAQHGLTGRVVDYAVVDLPQTLRQAREQLARVEALSDAYHLSLGSTELLVAYLLEITRAKDGPARRSAP